MPVYTYACTACESVVERRQSFSDSPLTTCEACGGILRKVIHPAGIVFKGSGWYVTDSRKGGKSSSTSSDTESATESKKPETKVESGAGESTGEANTKSTTSESPPAKADTPATTSV